MSKNRAIYIYIYIQYRFDIFIKRFLLNKKCYHNSTIFMKYIDFYIVFLYNSRE